MEYSYMEPLLVDELINGVSINYEQYNNLELIEILSFLNEIAKNRKEIFCFEEMAIHNYKKIIDIVEQNVFDKEVLVGYTNIIYLEKMLKDENLKNKLKDEFIKEQLNLRKIENIKNNTNLYLKECFKMDKTLIVYIYHKTVYRGKGLEAIDLIRSSINYFMSTDEKNKKLYDDFVELYREKNIHLFERKPCKILEFPIKKKGFISGILKI